MESDPNTIDFNEIKKYVGVNDETLFLKYLKEVYKDLADRSESHKKQGIIQMTFLDYLKLPIFISEKLFKVFDVDKDSFLNPKEFIYGMKKLYNGTFKESIEIVFDLLDFSHSGIIEKDDVQQLLTYLPFKSDNSRIDYKYKMKDNQEIETIVSNTFNNKKTLTLSEFTKTVEKKTSDVFLQILCFLYQKKPFNTENIIALKDAKKKLPKEIELQTPLVQLNNTKKIPMPSPMMLSASPAVEIITGIKVSKFNLDETEDENTKSSKKQVTDSPKFSKLQGVVRYGNQKILEDPDKLKDGNQDINEVIKNSTEVYNSPSKILKKKSTKKAVPSLFLDSRNKEKQSEKVVTKFKLEDETPEIELKPVESPDNDNDDQTKKTVDYEANIYKLSESNKLKKYYLALIGKDIYYYKSSSKAELLGMHNLSGCFVRENNPVEIGGQKFYSFAIVFPTKDRNYYTDSETIYDNFVEALKKTCGYQNLFDLYDMLDTIGEGIFGLVKLGVYKKSKERVAIKIIKKEMAKKKDIELVKTEIDIMKLCCHPNIVRLLDHFENSDFIFIVMEYIGGGSLSSYLEKRKFNITENKAAEFIFQIAQGIKYLHSIGIVHRDLKPDNIMLTSSEDNGKIKIMDFGLSKILGRKETTVDGFGTLTFVAPQVLVRTPYGKEVDIWSLGVIMYLMLGGILPFDDMKDNEEKIAKSIVYKDVQFPEKNFSGRSSEAIDLIRKCLTKDPSKRIKINDILEHKWIKNNLDEEKIKEITKDY